MLKNLIYLIYGNKNFRKYSNVKENSAALYIGHSRLLFFYFGFSSKALDRTYVLIILSNEGSMIFVS